ncbi:hypothetical protein EDD86DRAFT_199845 [Gorgonomyces haynaldii]|nr:hypothetical protein EDD86DRAFT_199845 [Gorgonomyces haynaldii]
MDREKKLEQARRKLKDYQERKREYSDVPSEVQVTEYSNSAQTYEEYDEQQAYEAWEHMQFENARLSGLVEQLELQVQQLTDTNLDLQVKFTKLQEQSQMNKIHDIQQQKLLLETSVSRLQETVRNQEQTIQMLQESRTRNDTSERLLLEKQALSEIVEQKQEQIQSLSQLLLEKDKTNAQVSLELLDLKQEHGTLVLEHQDLLGLVEKEREWNAEKAEMEQKIALLQDQVLKSQNTSLDQQFKQSLQEIDQLRHRSQALLNENKEMVKQLEELRKHQITMTNERAKMIEEISLLKSLAKMSRPATPVAHPPMVSLAVPQNTTPPTDMAAVSLPAIHPAFAPAVKALAQMVNTDTNSVPQLVNAETKTVPKDDGLLEDGPEHREEPKQEILVDPMEAPHVKLELTKLKQDLQQKTQENKKLQQLLEKEQKLTVLLSGTCVDDS